MSYTIKNQRTLRKILWLDTSLGGLTAVSGLLFLIALTGLLGLKINFILTVSTITLVYASVALILALQKSTSVRLLRLLVFANWLWTFVSIILLFIHYNSATHLGVTFLIIQVIVVGGLAYLEGTQIVKKQAQT